MTAHGPADPHAPAAEGAAPPGSSGALQASLLVEASEPTLFFWLLPRATVSLSEVLPPEVLEGGETQQEQLLFPVPGTRKLAPREITGCAVPLGHALPFLARAEQRESARAASIRFWATATGLLLELVAQHRILPGIETGGSDQWTAGWRVAPGEDQRTAFEVLVRNLPPVAVGSTRWSSKRREHYLRRFLDAGADFIVRSAASQRTGQDGKDWQDRWVGALLGPDPSMRATNLGERQVPEKIRAWTAPALAGEQRQLALLLTVVEPRDEDGSWRLGFALVDPRDPGQTVPARAAWRDVGLPGQVMAARPSERMLEALRAGAEQIPGLRRALAEDRPEGVDMTPEEISALAGPLRRELAAKGIEVRLPVSLVPTWREEEGLSLELVLDDDEDGEDILGAWRLRVGGDALAKSDVDRLIRSQGGPVKVAGRWLVLREDERKQLARLLDGEQAMSFAAALRHALAGETDTGLARQAIVVAQGSVQALLRKLSEGSGPAEASAGFTGQLRPYQEAGLGWLLHRTQAGLGACLADDMGLGKTIQVIALLAARAELDQLSGPSLVVCPTSMLGSWARELARFSPTLAVSTHHGGSRARSEEELSDRVRKGSVLLTTYTTLRRDAALLGGVSWDHLILDEAQAIKNPESRQSQVVRGLNAKVRVAMSGTPVENKLEELWSIMSFLNPGLLGPLPAFRRTYARPIEQGRDPAAAARLRGVVGPFVLRRVKTDPDIVKDLPAKNQLLLPCGLTSEQQELYQRALSEHLVRLKTSEGGARRGLILALITKLKQVCNHPAQFLGEEEAELPRRSGKLAQLREKLRELTPTGERALVFTQYRQMGTLLERQLSEDLGTPIPFLHGGLDQSQREAMIADFQDSETGPPVMILSLRAAGTGLTLTRANHVFHFDRWWNPAVEDQATDRAHRIGQKRTVWVHKLVCAGTLEERIDQLLESKRELMDAVVAQGGSWLADMSDEALLELLHLERDLATTPEDEHDDEAPQRT